MVIVAISFDNAAKRAVCGLRNSAGRNFGALMRVMSFYRKLIRQNNEKRSGKIAMSQHEQRVKAFEFAAWISG
jgi:hypothetical protein